MCVEYRVISLVGRGDAQLQGQFLGLKKQVSVCETRRTLLPEDIENELQTC